MPTKRFATQHCPVEWSYLSGQAYPDPGNEIELDVVVTAPDGRVQRVPTFWAGDQEWRVRYAPSITGRHRFRTECSDPGNPDLHGLEGVLEVAPYTGSNPLLRHGPLRVNAGRRHFEHADGTPFLWLGDTWWMGLTRRLSWPEEFQLLAADRVQKGFNVVQIVAGLYPDMPAYDPRGFNEAGHPWEAEYARLNPAYFDMADLRIQWLARVGLVPAVVGCWGYHLPWLGMERMKRHWRNLVARWGAYPVVWILAGEATMPYYLAEDKTAAAEFQRQGWTELARYVREIDPYRHPLTLHPGDTARNTVSDPTVLDYDMLQTGHGGAGSIPNTVKRVSLSRDAEPTLPVVNGEVCYEGILENSREEIQRFMFWNNLLLGARGFTYGANGIWQLNQEGIPYGPSPHGASWGDTPWSVAYRLPGSGQLGIAKRFLERYPWWRFECHPEWIEPHFTVDQNPSGHIAAGIPGQVRVIYFHQPIAPWSGLPIVKGLEAGSRYRVFWFDPKTGEERGLPEVSGGQGEWQVPMPATMADWVLVLERR
ncbi:MAG: DUF4038 domain-containing protein [Candidatus Latescibacterota bacterium]|jgi:hypothetical protein